MTWIANLLIVIGLWKAGNKSKAAFGFTIVGEAIWTVVATYREQWDLASICAIFTILAAINLWKWNKETLGVKDECAHRKEVSVD